MITRGYMRAVFAASLLALLGLAVGGMRSPLHASDSGACVMGGNGPLCYTIQVQTCVEWIPVTYAGGLGGVTVGWTCAKWETRTTYYYNDTGSGGVIIKPLR